MMLTERLNLKRLFKILFCFSLAFLTSNTWGLSSDKDQPIEVEADYAELDDEKGLTIYKGNVIVTQGSMKIKGDTMTVTYNANSDLDTMVVVGKPAHYQQLPDNSKVPDEAEGLRMEYFALKNYIVLMNNALVKQEGLRFSGNRIEYDTERSIVKAKGNASAGNTDGSKKKDPNARVKITLKPKKKK